MTAANNPDNAESLAGSVVLACALAPPFAALFVALRFYTARKILRTIHVDDWLILAALILSIGYSISLGFLTKHGLGYHREYLRGPHVRLYNLRIYMLLAVIPTPITGNLASLFTKTSILRFYLRFPTSRRFTVTVYVVMVLVILANLLGAFGFLFGCQPIWYQWDYYTMKGGSCKNMDPFYAWLVIFNCITDGVLLALPAWIIGPLRVSLAQKAALAAILGTGGFVLGVSILRVVMVASTWGDKDITYKFATNYIWSIIEMNVGIACASAPCLRALVGRYIPSLLHLGRRDENVDLYTIPVSQVARQLPELATNASAEAGSYATTCSSWSWPSKLFAMSKSSREERI